MKDQLVTLFTSEPNKKKLRNSFFIYLGVSGFVLLFAIVYEQFSHEVISYYMIFAFLYPLLMGALVYLILFLAPFSKLKYQSI